ncbi:type III secretion system outer membrane ring subunit SctC [Sodalis endosymbiont of Spalangia cameroni]|uniref:type III secretion system outer membrane ring subunit SctC n=1 Tax=Sodalis praecaptivus TaxID=1239307 RepID=UPI0031F9D0BD
MSKVVQFLKIGCAWLLLAAVGVPAASWAGPFRSEQTSNEIASSSTNEYVANKSSIRQLLSTLAGEIHKPIIVSELAGRKQVSGKFDMNKPLQLLENLAAKTALIWYNDGSAIYVYDVNEMQSQMVQLRHAPFDRLVAFLKSTMLYDQRFPPRTNGSSGGFYISGPPVYVGLVTAAAKYLDSTFSDTTTGKNEIRVIKLKNSFVTDRNYSQRDAPVSIPGVATVLNQLLNGGNGNGAPRDSRNPVPLATITIDRDTRSALTAANAAEGGGNFPPLPPLPQQNKSSQPADNVSYGTINIVAYPDTNSLLIQGASQQVSYVQDLVTAIDIAKQQIQLSLWILDIDKDEVNQLGVNWSGSARMGNGGIAFNSSSLSATNSTQFLAEVSALAKRQEAQIVAHPEILTQENIPALFDNNSSFYVQVKGERTATLEKITYGTLISVLPRLSSGSKEIEMILDIQDGGLTTTGDNQITQVAELPLVNNTQISTEARVPKGSSLLVGGYSRDQRVSGGWGIPLLRDIPFLGRLFDYRYKHNKQFVRMFLIQPKLLPQGAVWEGVDENTSLGQTSLGTNITLKATVAMLHNYMAQH